MKYFLLFVLSIVATVFAIDTIVVDTVTVDTIVNNVSDIVDAAKNLNTNTVAKWLVIAAVIKLLISLTRYVPVMKLLNSQKMKPYKPYVSVVLGLLSGVAVNMAAENGTLITNLLAGLAAGLGSVGLHETVKTVRGKNA